jgi:chromate transporter
MGRGEAETMIFLLLLYEFFKTGLLAVGGGLATIPFLQGMVDKYGWITQAELLNILAVAESTPGPIGVNAATYIGFRVAGIPGALVATLALVLPSLIVIMLVVRALNRFKDASLTKRLFLVLRPVSIGLIAAAAAGILMEVLNIRLQAARFNINFWGAGVFAIILTLQYVPKIKKLHPLVFISAAGLLGLIIPF